MRQVDQITLTKAVLWEEAKGKLRAVVAAEGSQRSGGADMPFIKISDAVEKFIDEFEGEGFHE